MYFILDGQVEIFLRVRSAQKSVAVLKKGDILGEMAVVDAKPRSATAVAKTDVKCLALNLAQLEMMIQTDPGFAIRVIRLLSAKLREANEHITKILSKDTRKQIADALNTFGKTAGKKTFKGVRLMIDEFVDHADNSLGFDRLDVRRTIDEMIKEGYLEYGASGKDEIVLVEKFEKLLM
jgi:CRP-like cAMP-binding protein